MHTGRNRIRDYPDILDVSQMAQLLLVSKKTAYKILGEDKIAFIRVGHQYRIPKANIIRYLRIIEV
jgi:excisionase family DNA binding protein